MATHRAKVIEGGKVVLPAALRRELGIETGDFVTLEREEGSVRLRPYRENVRRAQEIVARYVPEERRRAMMEEFFAERRAAAARGD